MLLSLSLSLSLCRSPRAPSPPLVGGAEEKLFACAEGGWFLLMRSVRARQASLWTYQWTKMDTTPKNPPCNVFLFRQISKQIYSIETDMMNKDYNKEAYDYMDKQTYRRKGTARPVNRAVMSQMHSKPKRHNVGRDESEVFLLAQEPTHGALYVWAVLTQQVGLQGRHPARAQGEADHAPDADVLSSRHARARHRDNDQAQREHHHCAEGQRDGSVPIMIHNIR